MPTKITGYTVYRQPSLWSHARALMRETFANSELVKNLIFADKTFVERRL